MAKLPSHRDHPTFLCSLATLLNRSASRRSSYISQEFVLLVLKTVYQNLFGKLHSFTFSCMVSSAPFCLCCASPLEVPLYAFRQWRIPTLRLPVWGLPHQSESHLNPSHSPPMCQYSYRAPCISQLQDRCCHYGSRSWSATLGYPSSSSSFFIIITIFIIYTKNVRLFALQIARKLVMAGQARYMNNFNKTSYLINL